MIEKVRLKAQIIWYFPSIVNVVKITRPLRSYRTPHQMRTAKHKSAYSSLIIGPRGLQCETNL